MGGREVRVEGSVKLWYLAVASGCKVFNEAVIIPDCTASNELMTIKRNGCGRKVTWSGLR
jgi:hypothetical protein